MPRNRTLKPNEYGGFILGFEPARTDTIEEYLASNFNVSESFSSQDWNLQDREMMYLVRRQPRLEIFGVALLQKRGRGGGTKRIKMRFAESFAFDEPIRAYEAANADGLQDVISTADNLKRIDVESWRRLNLLIKSLRPANAKSLDALTLGRSATNTPAPRDERRSRLAEERDAIGLALDIAGLDRPEIFRQTTVERLGAARSILDLIDAQPIAERTLIERDSAVFGMTLGSVFKNARVTGERGREVRAYVVDSTPLETATGVDLLLYQEQFNSFLLLQYKAMEKDDVVAGWSYRIDGTNLLDQLETMSRIRRALPFESPRALKDQRLNDEPFYFKFCERSPLAAGDEALVSGITMNALHLDHFLTLPDASIEGHGRRVGYENCPRYLNNTEFFILARAGWIGCQGYTTEAIERIIDAREKGRIAIVAVIKGLELRATNRARHR